MSKKKALLTLFFLASSLLSIAQDTIDLKTYFRDLKCVDIYVDGKKYNFLFDTGGGETFISPEIARSIKKEIYGGSTGLRMDGEMIKYQKADSVSLKIGTSEIFHNTIGVWDIMSILPKELPKVDGIISLKSFQNELITIDLSKNLLIIENRQSLEQLTRSKTLLQSRFANGYNGEELNLLIGLPKSNRFYWFLFDTGNIGPVVFSPECANAWGIQSNSTDSTISSTKVDLMLGGNNITTSSISRKIILDGALNFESLSRYIFTIDLRKKEVWMN